MLVGPKPEGWVVGTPYQPSAEQLRAAAVVSAVAAAAGVDAPRLGPAYSAVAVEPSALAALRSPVSTLPSPAAMLRLYYAQHAAANPPETASAPLPQPLRALLAAAAPAVRRDASVAHNHP